MTAVGKKIVRKIVVGLKELNIRHTRSLVHLSPKETAVLAKVHVAPILVHSTWGNVTRLFQNCGNFEKKLNAKFKVF